MDHFHYQNNRLYAEDVAVADIIKTYGTPCYIYSRATIERHWSVIDSVCGTWPHQICYAVKANDNIAVLDILNRLGSGFDIVSQGELERVLYVGGDPNKIVFSGVGKTTGEIQRALSVGIHCFNVESESELARIQHCASEMNKIASIAVRINPHVDANTHPYIATGLRDSKFGIATEQAKALYLQAKTLSHVKIIGVDCHIGSQITTLTPFVAALKSVLAFVNDMKACGITFDHIDIGGGLGVPYQQGEQVPTPAEYTEAIIGQLQDQDKPLPIILEPGRMIMANAGILVSRIEYIKQTGSKDFAVMDAGMNDLLRPALYQAWHDIIPVCERKGALQPYDVVGPVCESADSFGKMRNLCIEQGDYLAIRGAGAYGASMGSQYNGRVRAAEVMVDGKTMHLIREREPLSNLWQHEKQLQDKDEHA